MALRKLQMTVLNIRHRTTYRYREPVRLGPHRLMLRPRESRDLRLLSSTLEMTPAASLSWTTDVFGNAVATAGFAGLADGLTIESRVMVELGASPWPVYDIAPSAIHYPFFYSSEERADLGALATPQTFDASGRLGDWSRAFVRGERTDTLALLKDMATGVAAGIGYQSREAEGTQTPLQTIDRGWGSCRDFAVLFAEAARCLGFGADHIGLSLQPGRRAGGGWHDPCVGRDFCPRCGLDNVRSDQPGGRRLQSHPARCRSRHRPGDADDGHLPGHDGCLSGHVGRRGGHAVRIAPVVDLPSDESCLLTDLSRHDRKTREAFLARAEQLVDEVRFNRCRRGDRDR